MNSVEPVLVDTDRHHHHHHSTTTTITTSEEDEQVQRLEASGALQQVVGSQSILSQELLYSDDGDSNKNNDDEDNNNNINVIVFGQEDSQDSNEKEVMTPAKAAQRYGLLTQDDDDDDDDGSNNSNKYVSMSNVHQQRQPNCLFDAHQNEQGSLFGTSATIKQAPVATLLGQQQQPQPLLYQSPLHHPEEEKKEDCDGDNEALGQSQLSLSQETLNLSSAANLGSLLDAIQHIEEFGESSSFVRNQQHHQQGTRTRKRSSPRIAAASAVASNKRRRVTASPHTLQKNNKKKKNPLSAATTTTTTPPRKKGGITPPATPLPHTSTTAISLDKNLAQAAAELAARAINDQDLSKKLLLSMALRRTSPRTAPQQLPGPGHILEDGFFWAHYPPLEKVLKQHMEEYYRLSMSKCQSAQQQQFNNNLVGIVRQAAEDQGWTFDPIFFSDKDLRDRIRCYYKTHIQNAKKRLNTMLRNPSKRSNSVHLMQHFDLIKSTLKKEQNVAAAAAATVSSSSSKSSSTAKSPARGGRKNKRAGKNSNSSSQQLHNIFCQ